MDYEDEDEGKIGGTKRRSCKRRKTIKRLRKTKRKTRKSNRKGKHI
jgi:hypothetical protein